MIFGKGLAEKLIVRLNATAEELDKEAFSHDPISRSDLSIRRERLITIATMCRIFANIVKQVVDEG